MLVSPVTFEDGELLAGRDFRAREPSSASAQDCRTLGVGVALVGQFLDVVEEVKTSKSVFRPSAAARQAASARWSISGLTFVAAEHGAGAVR